MYREIVYVIFLSCIEYPGHTRSVGMVGYIKDAGLAAHAATNGMSFMRDKIVPKASLCTGAGVPLLTVPARAAKSIGSRSLSGNGARQ
jgi:hypothetical protein